MSDYNGIALMLAPCEGAKALLGDRGYDTDWFCKTLAVRNITACIPPKRHRKIQIRHDAALYSRQLQMENMFNNSKMGGASTPTTIVAPTLSSGSLQPSSSGSIDES